MGGRHPESLVPLRVVLLLGVVVVYGDVRGVTVGGAHRFRGAVTPGRAVVLDVTVDLPAAPLSIVLSRRSVPETVHFKVPRVFEVHEGRIDVVGNAVAVLVGHVRSVVPRGVIVDPEMSLFGNDRRVELVHAGGRFTGAGEIVPEDAGCLAFRAWRVPHLPGIVPRNGRCERKNEKAEHTCHDTAHKSPAFSGSCSRTLR